MKLTDEEKRQMLEEVLKEGISIATVTTRHGVSYKTFYKVVERARIHGIESVLHKNTPRSYTQDFKLKVVNAVLSGKAQARTAVEYNLTWNLVEYWCRKYAERGIGGLSDARRSRPLKEDQPEKTDRKGRPVHTEKEYQELERKYRHARMENEFLKKLDALVRERIEREKGK